MQSQISSDSQFKNAQFPFITDVMFFFYFKGLTCHRYRPFTVASCSRDSTVRIWSMSHLACSLQIDVLAERPLDNLMTTNIGMC